MADELKVVVSADASRLNTEMAKATNSLQKFKAGSAQAQQSLMNLGRVVQDAPFGFIGIANNIDPLLASFQSLKKETGSAGGALKSLFNALTGPSGIAIAISAITTAITFATNGFSAWTRGIFQNEEAVKKTKEAIDNAAQSIANEKVQVDILVEKLRNENLTRNQRIAAIKKLQDIAPAYFGTLDAEKSKVEDITRAYDNFNASILRRVNAEAVRKQLVDVTEQIIKLQLKGSNLTSQQVSNNGKLKKSYSAILASQEDALTLAEQYKAVQNGTLLLTGKENRELQNLLVTQAKLVELVSKYQGNESFIKGIEESKKKLKELKDIQYEVFRVKPLPSISDNEIINFQNELQKDLDKGVNSLPSVITVPAAVKLVGSKEFNDDINKKVFQPVDQFFSGQLLQAVQGTINVLIDGISQAFSGDVGGGLNNIFKGLLNVVGDFLIQLGLAAIGIGKLYAAIQAGFSNPVSTITAGIAALVLGTLLKSFVPKFATGTRFAPGGTALVGERGPELVSLPEGARVTPAAQTGAILGGAMQSIQVYGVMRGRDIYFTNQRYGNSFNVGT